VHDVGFERVRDDDLDGRVVARRDRLALHVRRLCCTAVLHVARYMLHVARSKLLADMDPSNGMAPSAGAPSVEVSCEPNM
jgi:hypothetical protein